MHKFQTIILEEALDNGSTMRFFKNREQVNKVCLMKGEMPSGQGEIAIDRMYADNNSLQVGDTLTRGKKFWKITGLVALVGLQCPVSDNNDSMFDSVKFGVGIVTPEEFETLDQEKLQYNYAWIIRRQPVDENKKRKKFLRISWKTLEK